MKMLLDLLLYPRSVFKRITGGRPALYAGILAVGLINVSYFVYKNAGSLYVETTIAKMTVNIILTILFAVVLGAVDVVFFGLPLYDLFKIFKKEGNARPEGSLSIKIMKVYILSHFIIVPVIYILEFIFFRHLTEESSNLAIYGAVAVTLAIIVWSSAIISRGINEIYSFQPVYRNLVFPVVMLWSFLLGEALGYVIDNWLSGLFL